MTKLTMAVAVWWLGTGVVSAGLVSQSTHFFNTDNGGTAAGTISGPIFCNNIQTTMTLTELSSEFDGSLFAVSIELQGQWLRPDQEFSQAMSNLASHPQTSNSQYIIEEQWLAGGILHYDHPVIITTHLTNQLFADNFTGAVAGEMTIVGGVFTMASCNFRRQVWVGSGPAPTWFNDWSGLITAQGVITENYQFQAAPEPVTGLVLFSLFSWARRR